MAWNAQQQAERHRQKIEDDPGRQHVRTRCLHCPAGHRFSYTGTLRAGQARLAQHRLDRHPELPPLDDARQTSKRTVRGTRKGLNSHNTRRENVSQEELHERELLRRMVRSDLPALEETST